MSRTDKLTDPYHHLTWAVGSGDDFVCFDYAVLPNGRIRLHAVLNSETGHFIQDFQEPADWPKDVAVAEAVGLVDAALEWCFDNDVRHSVRGWNQDPMYFARCVERWVNGTLRPAGRKSRRVPTLSKRGPA